MLAEFLGPEGYSVHLTFTAKGGMRAAVEGGFVLIILDVMLPDMSGFDVLSMIRKNSHIPVIMLTTRITRLKATAQLLASGDLSARVSPQNFSRRDELSELGREFNAMAAKIQILMSSQKRFVADVSYELGAPLTRMHLAIALLRRRLEAENCRELDRIEHETDQLSDMVQQLLLVARMEAGSSLAETLIPVSIKALCDSVIEDASFEADHVGCRISGNREQIRLMAFPQLLRRAVDNVRRNAIRYAPPGSEVALNCLCDSEGIKIEALDNGPGVPESMLKDIFQPFFRTAPGRETDSGGTGLGLAIAREAIRLHDGTITARNRQVRGLEVTILIPSKCLTNHELC
jgi:two-component system sensor histidine kinase CpxA